MNPGVWLMTPWAAARLVPRCPGQGAVLPKAYELALRQDPAVVLGHHGRLRGGLRAGFRAERGLFRPALSLNAHGLVPTGRSAACLRDRRQTGTGGLPAAPAYGVSRAGFSDRRTRAIHSLPLRAALPASAGVSGDHPVAR